MNREVAVNEEGTDLETVIRPPPLAQSRVFGCDDFFEHPPGARFVMPALVAEPSTNAPELAPSLRRGACARFLAAGPAEPQKTPTL